MACILDCHRYRSASQAAAWASVIGEGKIPDNAVRPSHTSRMAVPEPFADAILNNAVSFRFSSITWFWPDSKLDSTRGRNVKTLKLKMPSIDLNRTIYIDKPPAIHSAAEAITDLFARMPLRSWIKLSSR